MRSTVFNKTFLSRRSVLSFERSTRKKSLSEALMLTSLIDAFSILVVYLLMGFSSTGEMSYMSSDIKLPTAQSLERLDRYPVIQIKKEVYFIEKKQIKKQELVAELVALKKKLLKQYGENSEKSDTITVQADRAISYSKISPIIQASSHAGFSDLKFAVLGNNQ